MPQFVILRHTLPAGSPRPSHFDLMLEDEGQLLTWALAELPNEISQLAEELPLHRIDYLTYEGPVSNNRGEVQRAAGGTFDWLQRDIDHLAIRVRSSQLIGEIRLRRTQGQQWTMQFTTSAR
jgi:hypothetical protein